MEKSSIYTVLIVLNATTVIRENNHGIILKGKTK